MVTYGKISPAHMIDGTIKYIASFSKTAGGTFRCLPAFFPNVLAAKHALWALGNNVDITVVE